MNPPPAMLHREFPSDTALARRRIYEAAFWILGSCLLFFFVGLTLGAYLSH